MNKELEKNAKITVRFRHDEYKHLGVMAREMKLSISEYIRRKLFEDEMLNDKYDAYDQEISIAEIQEELRYIKKIEIICAKYIKTLAEKTLNAEDLQKASEDIASRLRELGYE